MELAELITNMQFGESWVYRQVSAPPSIIRGMLDHSYAIQIQAVDTDWLGKMEHNVWLRYFLKDADTCRGLVSAIADGIQEG